MNARILICFAMVLLLTAVPVLGGDLTKIYGSIPKNGVNQVTLDNSPNEKEAVVVFKELTWPIPFAVYLPPHQTGILKLPSEPYQVCFTLGYGWNVATNRFNAQPEYYMVAGVFNAGEAGTVHDEKTDPENIIIDEYIDDEGVIHQMIEKTESAEWKWAESSIPLFPVPSSPDALLPMSESDFPLS